MIVKVSGMYRHRAQTDRLLHLADSFPVVVVKRRVDRDPRRAGQYLMTGSQQWQVMRTLAESLASRTAFLDLYGFSLQELGDSPAGWLPRWLERPEDLMAGARQTRRYGGNLQDWLWRGSLPRAVEIAAAVVPDFWTGYHRTSIERDARLLAEVEDWRSAGGAEVDLVLERDGVLYPFEFKLTAAPNRRMASGLEAFQQAHGHLRVTIGALICAVEQPRWISETAVALPWDLL